MRLTMALLAGTMFLAACTQAPEAPRLSIKDLMAQQVQPTAEIYWDSVRYVSDETGEHDIVPRDEEDWERTRKAAADLIALGELLMTPPYAEGRSADWTEYSQGLIEVGRKAELAAQHRSVDEVFDVGATIYNVCTACHQAYPPAEAEMPGEAKPTDEAN